MYEILAHTFLTKLRESNIFTKEVKKDLISRNIFSSRENFFFPKCARFFRIVFCSQYLSFHFSVLALESLFNDLKKTEASMLELKTYDKTTSKLLVVILLSLSQRGNSWIFLFLILHIRSETELFAYGIILVQRHSRPRKLHKLEQEWLQFHKLEQDWSQLLKFEQGWLIGHIID